MEQCLFNPDKRRLGEGLNAAFDPLKGVRVKTEPNSSQERKNKAIATSCNKVNSNNGKAFTVRVLKHCSKLSDRLWPSILRNVQNLTECLREQAALAQ